MIRLFKHYIPDAVVLLALLDVALLFLAGELGWYLRATQGGLDYGDLIDRILPLMAFVGFLWIAMVSVGVYNGFTLRSLHFSCARFLAAVSLGLIALSLADFIAPGSTLWRSTLLYALTIAIGVFIISRIVVVKLLNEDIFQRRVIILGAGKRAMQLKNLAKQDNSGFSVISVVSVSEGEQVVKDAISRSTFGDFGQFAVDLGASELVLALEERRNSLPLTDLLRMKTTGIHISDFSSFVERETGRVDLASVNPSWLIFSDGFSSGRILSSAVKRSFDIVASSILLVLTLPVILFFAILIKIDSKGPAFFHQSRVGLFGQSFDIIKLRSMRIDAEKNGAQWAEKDDPRITRVGRFIRMVRIDELPQAWSVLKGQMSFVGPRPEVAQFVHDLEEQLPYYAERHMVKPGITGWAQVNYPYGASLEDARHKLEYDLYYVKNYSPFLDMLILLQTLQVILWPEGAR